MAVGRKGEYEEWLKDEKLLMLKDWVRQGLTDSQLCKNIGISTTTFYDWKNRFPKFADVLKRTKQVVDAEVENALFKRALGYDVIEEKTVVDADGIVTQTIRTRKHIPADTTAQIYWLNNRRPNIWRNKIEQTNDEEVIKSLNDITEAMKRIRGE